MTIDTDSNNAGTGNNDDACTATVIGDDGDSDEIDYGKNDLNNKRWKENHECNFFDYFNRFLLNLIFVFTSTNSRSKHYFKLVQ